MSGLLTVFQILAAIGVGFSQHNVMRDSIAGVSITWLSFWLSFLLTNLAIAVSAVRVFPSRTAKQTVVIYAVWSVVIASILLDLLFLGGQWKWLDSLTATLTLSGVFLSIIWAKVRGIPISDPFVLASFAVFFKGIPQITLAWLIFQEGGDGLSSYAVLFGHAIIGLRLFQITFSIREAGWDNNRRCIFVGEAANGLSWLVATLVWLLV